MNNKGIFTTVSGALIRHFFFPAHLLDGFDLFVNVFGPATPQRTAVMDGGVALSAD